MARRSPEVTAEEDHEDPQQPNGPFETANAGRGLARSCLSTAATRAQSGASRSARSPCPRTRTPCPPRTSRTGRAQTPIDYIFGRRSSRGSLASPICSCAWRTRSCALRRSASACHRPRPSARHTSPLACAAAGNILQDPAKGDECADDPATMFTPLLRSKKSSLVTAKWPFSYFFSQPLSRIQS